MSLTCQQCGQPFERAHRTGASPLYCSLGCRDRAGWLRAKSSVGKTQPLEARACRTCGATFTPRRGGRPQEYCSKPCRKRAYWDKEAAALRATRGVQTRVCRRCGKTFTTTRPQTRYCSPDCHIDFRIAALKEVRDAKAAGRRCTQCGDAMPISRRLNARYCSRVCASAAQVVRLKATGRHRRRPGEYEVLSKMQDGRCAVCGTDKPGSTQRFLSIDHDHVTGEVRGLLCQSCNVAIGHLHDDPDLLRRAIAYLADPPARRVR